MGFFLDSKNKSYLLEGVSLCFLFANKQLFHMSDPEKFNTTKPSLMKEGIGFGSSLYRFIWFGVPFGDFSFVSLGITI